MVSSFLAVSSKFSVTLSDFMETSVAKTIFFETTKVKLKVLYVLTSDKTETVITTLPSFKNFIVLFSITATFELLKEKFGLTVAFAGLNFTPISSNFITSSTKTLKCVCSQVISET